MEHNNLKATDATPTWFRFVSKLRVLFVRTSEASVYYVRFCHLYSPYYIQYLLKWKYNQCIYKPCIMPNVAGASIRTKVMLENITYDPPPSCSNLTIFTYYLTTWKSKPEFCFHSHTNIRINFILTTKIKFTFFQNVTWFIKLTVPTATSVRHTITQHINTL